MSACRTEFNHLIDNFNEEVKEKEKEEEVKEEEDIEEVEEVKEENILKDLEDPSPSPSGISCGGDII